MNEEDKSIRDFMRKYRMDNRFGCFAGPQVAIDSNEYGQCKITLCACGNIFLSPAVQEWNNKVSVAVTAANYDEEHRTWIIDEFYDSKSFKEYDPMFLERIKLAWREYTSERQMDDPDTIAEKADVQRSGIGVVRDGDEQG